MCVSPAALFCLLPVPVPHPPPESTEVPSLTVTPFLIPKGSIQTAQGSLVYPEDPLLRRPLLL